MKKILIALTTALLLAACSNDNDPAAINDGRRVPLQVRGYIADTPLGITRAHDTAWDTGDKIGLYALNITTPIEDGSNVCYFLAGTTESTNGSKYEAFTSTTTINLPEDGSPIDVYGYYPYSSDPIDPEAVAVNLSTQNPQKNIDLMTTGKVSASTQGGSTPISINEPSCELLFHHRLTKLEFNLTFIDFDDIKNTSLTIGSQKTTATYNIYTDELTYGSGEAYQTITAAEIEISSSDNKKTFEAIVLPNHAENNRTPDERKVTIVVDGKSYSFTIVKTGADTNNKVLTDSFDAGYKYVYNVTVYPFTITVDPDKYTEQW